MSSWDGVDDMFAFMDQIAGAADEATKEVVAVAAARLVRESQANFVGSHARGEPHVGGNRPNIVSGDLRRSIIADPITRHKAADYSTVVAPREIYGRRVELGFQGSPAYEYFQPAVLKVEPDFQRDAADIWKKHIGRL